MAWGNLAGVSKLLTSLQQLEGGGVWGKNSGKSSSKGWGKGKNGDECFTCLWDDCWAAQAQKVTWGKSNCFGCGRHKGVAKSPPLERITEKAMQVRLELNKGKGKDLDDKGNSGKGSKWPKPRTQAATADAEKLAELRADRLAALKGEAGSATPSGLPSPPSPSAAAPKSTNKQEPSTLCEGALESAPLVADLIQPVLELVAADWVAVVPTDLDPEEGLKTLLQSSSQLSTADDKEALETGIAEANKALETTTAPAVRKCLQDQIASDTAALTKMVKKATPSLATQLAALKEAEKALLRQTSEREDKEAAGKRKALARGEERREFFAEVKSQLAIIERAVEAHEEQSAALHEAKSQRLDGYEKTMLARLQTRIVAAEKPNAENKAAAQAAEAVATKAANEAVNQAAAATKRAEAAAEEVTAKHAELLQKVEKLQAEAQKAQVLRQQALAIQQAELVFAGADAKMLPAEVAPKAGVQAFWKVCGHLYQLLERWHLGGNIAVTLAELSHHAMAKETTQALMKKLLGTELWGGWFGKPDFMMADESILPRQLLTYLHLALTQLKSNYEAGEEVKKAAARDYAMLAEANTKRRKVEE